MKKNLFSLVSVVVVLMLVLVLSACGSETENDTKDDETPKEDVTDAEELSGEVKIMVPSGGYYLEHVRDVVAAKFMDENPEVKVIVEQEPDGGQLTARIAAGDIPDVLVGVFGYQPAKFARDNLIVDLKDMPGSEELFDRIAPQYVQEDFGGRYYVPWNATTQMMIYNKELFEEAGLDPNSPPETFEQYLEYAEKINSLPDRENTKIYGNVFWNEALAWGGWYWTMNSQIYYNFNNAEYQLFNELGTDIVFDKEEAKLVEFYEFMNKAQTFAPSSMEGNEFFSRNVGMWLQFGYGWKANLKEAKDQEMVIGEDVGIAPIPVLNAGDTNWSTLDGRSLMVFKSQPEREQLAFEFIKFMMEDDVNLESLKVLEQLPTLTSLVDDEYFQADDIKPFVDQLENTVINEAVAEVDDISNILLQNYIKSVIQNEMTVEEAVEDAASEARKILDGQ